MDEQAQGVKEETKNSTSEVQVHTCMQEEAACGRMARSISLQARDWSRPRSVVLHEVVFGLDRSKR